MASSTSPWACRMARAASSGSYSDPSVMTRETSTPSWPATAAWSIGGRQVSPRPCLASSAWALMMARSPPLTATYIGSVLLLWAGGQPGGAGQGRHRVVVHQQQVDAAREESGVAAPRLGETVGGPRGGERRGAVDARSAGGEAGRPGAAADVEHDRGGQVRCFVGAQRQGCQRGQRAGVGENEVGGRRVGPACAGVEREPGGDLGVAGERAAQPECALLVEQGKRDGGEAAAERGGRLGGPGQRVAAGGVGERVEHGAEGTLRVAGRVGEA